MDGLSSGEACQRLALHGRNELRAQAPLQPWRLFGRQFLSPLVCLLFVAAAIAGAMGDTLDCAAILAILLLNSVIGFQQEFRAEKAIAALKSLTAPRAHVRRDGEIHTVSSAELVPGDVVELGAGDVVPADAVLIEASGIRCVEAALTGESEPAIKRAGAQVESDAPLGDRGSMVFMGTALATGSGCAVVVATGSDTEIGRIATLIDLPDAQTPLQQRLDAFSRLLLWCALASVMLLFALGWWRGEPAGMLFLTSVSLAVAAVPEGLPAVISIALAIGVGRMARRGTLIRKLPAVETLGCTSVICTDKTGTLTAGCMTVRALLVAGRNFEVTGEGYAPHGQVTPTDGGSVAGWSEPLREYAAAAAGCADARLVVSIQEEWTATGDPTEAALVAVAEKLGLSTGAHDREAPRIRDFAFDPDRKSRVVLRLAPGNQLRAVVNGAPEMLLGRCTRFRGAQGVRELTEADREAILHANQIMAARGLRVIGTAIRNLEGTPAGGACLEEVERDLVFLGLAGMQDLPRPGVTEAVAQCRRAGVRPVMITGDHPHTALAIAREIGLAGPDDHALSGAEMDRLTDSELQQQAPATAVYARVTPEHKLRIVRAWRGNAAVVAMTGDGVNDAPAIKGADIGIAMGRSGTDVSREAADMVLTDDNFSTIVAAIEEGRGVYSNIQRTLQYLLASNSGEVALVLLSILGGLPVPLLPVHLLWINLVTDSLPALCLAASPVEADVMKHSPRPRTEKIAHRRFLVELAVVGGFMAAVALGVYLYFLGSGGLAIARTAAFDCLILAQLLLALGMRSGSRPCWRRDPAGGNGVLLAVIAFSLLLQVAFHWWAPLRQFLQIAPLSLTNWLSLGAIALIPLGAHEAMKFFHRDQVVEGHGQTAPPDAWTASAR
jgi:Ca2+-transporting ATPase